MASSPFLGEIRIMAFTFPPKGWQFCNGQLLSIQQNSALFALFGTTYGGNGTTNFALPNLQGRVPAGWGGQQWPTLGEVAGEAAHTLIISEIPSHTHAMAVSTTAPLINATGRNPAGAIPAQQAAIINAGNVQIWGTGPISAKFSPGMVANTGGQPHQNMQPYLALNFCVALSGIFPSRN
jgi:microcystin-dependent protein